MQNWKGNNMVEWKRLGDVCKVLRGKRLTKSQLNESEGYPVLHGGSTPMGYYNESNRKANTTVVVNTGNAGSVFFYDKEFWSSDACFSIYPNKEIIDKFLYLYVYGCERILKGKIRAGAMPTIDAKAVEDLTIPIPSLSEQNRIVGILDIFTKAIDNLKQEIDNRKKQYEYYRDLLLNLEGKSGVEMKSLGELFTFKNGLNKGKEFFGKGKPIIMFTNVFNSRYIKSSMIKSKVDISQKELERIDAHIGDVFFTRTSETQEDVGYASVLIEDIKECTFAGFLIRARPITERLLPEYCKYCFSVPSVRQAIVANSSFTTRASLTGNGLGKVVLPIPSIPEQSHIVSILDRFEASISNMEQQMAQRQRQYEYYRNKLLTFE